MSLVQNQLVQREGDTASLLRPQSLSPWCPSNQRYDKDNLQLLSYRCCMDNVDGAVDIVVLGHSVGDCLERNHNEVVFSQIKREYLGDRVVFHCLPVASAVLLYVEVNRQALAAQAANEEGKGKHKPHFATNSAFSEKLVICDQMIKWHA